MFAFTRIRSRRWWIVALILVLIGILATILHSNPDGSATSPLTTSSTPDKVTLYTADGSWKVVASAWITNVAVYKSIGTSVTVYNRRRVGGFLGLDPHFDWVEAPVDYIAISNNYSGFPAWISTRGNWSNTGHAELLEWAVGGNIHVDDQGNVGVGGGATLDLRRVDGSFWVAIGRETLQGVVTAGH